MQYGTCKFPGFNGLQQTCTRTSECQARGAVIFWDSAPPSIPAGGGLLWLFVSEPIGCRSGISVWSDIAIRSARSTVMYLSDVAIDASVRLREDGKFTCRAGSTGETFWQDVIC